jgi:hypothetical protein
VAKPGGRCGAWGRLDRLERARCPGSVGSRDWNDRAKPPRPVRHWFGIEDLLTGQSWRARPSHLLFCQDNSSPATPASRTSHNATFVLALSLAVRRACFTRPPRRRSRRTRGPVRQSSTLIVHDRLQGGPPSYLRSAPPLTCQNRGPGRSQPGRDLRSVAGAGHEKHQDIYVPLRGRMRIDSGCVGANPDLRSLGDLVNC